LGTAPHPTESRSPLSFPAFRTLWLAATFSNIGTFVQDVAQAWLMLDLTKSAMWVAAISVCLTAPSFVLSIPAGVLADRVDRRLLLALGQAMAALVALLLSLATWLHVAGPHLLLAASLGLGIASAINGPPWHSLVPELVPRELMPEAIALSSVSFNIARVAGPALGGYLLGLCGPSVSFLVNGVSFLAVIAVLLTNQTIRDVSRKTSAKAPPSESAWERAVEGVHMVYGDHKLRTCTLAVMTFVVPAAATMSVLPVFAKVELGMDATGYGSLVGALGVGAVAGASIMKRARGKIPPRLYAAAMMASFSGAVLVTALTRNPWIARAAFVVAGIGWVGTFSTLLALVQLNAPEGGKSRVVSVYSVSWLGGWVLSALFAGWLARRSGAAFTLETCAIWGILGAMVVSRLPLPAFPESARSPQP
jgi:MFS family permease